MREYKYYTYCPSGNDTALVMEDVKKNTTKKIINDTIMQENPNIEQVGFLSKTEHKLNMASNEFCGNATRCAIYEYLDGMEGKIDIEVSGCGRALQGGIIGENVYLEYQIVNKNKFTILENEYYKVELDGITHLVVSENEFRKYINRDMKQVGFELLEKYNLRENLANGVMFLEKVADKLKIHPIVWVKDIDTLFYETACGSGSIAIGIVMTEIAKKDICFSLLQPSGKVIEVKSIYLENAYNISISGVVTKNEKPKKVVIGE